MRITHRLFRGEKWCVIRTLPLSASDFLLRMANPVVFKILRFSGLPFLFRELVQRHRVTILLFHDISPETATRTFDYLSSNYHLLDLRTFVRACQTQDNASVSRQVLPPKSLIVTFDDGCIRNHELLPLLQARKIPVTIFLCAGIIGTKRHFWFKHKTALHRSFQLLKISDAGRRRLLRASGFTRRKEYDQPHTLTLSQIEEMKPWVDFQSHTLFHPCLPRCGLSQARVEIAQSREVLRRQCGLEVNALAYPHGNYSDRDIRLCEQAGYDCGLTVDPGFNTVKTNRYRLKRLPVNDTDDLNELIVKASGLWELLKRLAGKNREYGWTSEVEP